MKKLQDVTGVHVGAHVRRRRGRVQVTGFDIPHNFPVDFEPVFGMDVRSCIEYYRDALDRSEDDTHSPRAPLLRCSHLALAPTSTVAYIQRSDKRVPCLPLPVRLLTACRRDWEDTAALAARVKEAKDAHYRELTADGIPAFDGAARLIRRARASGIAVGVGSSGEPEKIARNLDASGLTEELDGCPVVSASHVARGKPAPDVYLEVRAPAVRFAGGCGVVARGGGGCGGEVCAWVCRRVCVRVPLTPACTLPAAHVRCAGRRCSGAWAARIPPGRWW